MTTFVGDMRRRAWKASDQYRQIDVIAQTGKAFFRLSKDGSRVEVCWLVGAFSQRNISVFNESCGYKFYPCAPFGFWYLPTQNIDKWKRHKIVHEEAKE